MSATGWRVGHGIDVHAFSEERSLVLAGVEIPAAPGLAGHSDADVVLHALVDALLGAAALGDIGGLFGSADPRYQGAPSRLFVDQAMREVRREGWEVANVDCTVIAQRPRLAAHRKAMRSAIAGMLDVDDGVVSVKATTTDGLGLTGRGEGIAAVAVVMLRGDRGGGAR